MNWPVVISIPLLFAFVVLYVWQAKRRKTSVTPADQMIAARVDAALERAKENPDDLCGECFLTREAEHLGGFGMDERGETHDFRLATRAEEDVFLERLRGLEEERVAGVAEEMQGGVRYEGTAGGDQDEKSYLGQLCGECGYDRGSTQHLDFGADRGTGHYFRLATRAEEDEIIELRASLLEKGAVETVLEEIRKDGR